MIQNSEGILLRKKDIRETSILLTFYTKEFGKILGVMKGLRSQKVGQYCVTPQLFSLNEIVFYEHPKKDIYTISTCDLKDFFAPIREDLFRIIYATYFVEMIDLMTPLGQKDERIFFLLLNCISALKTQASVKRIARVFEIRLLDYVGLVPVLDRCVVCSKKNEDRNFVRFSLSYSGVVCDGCAKTSSSILNILSGTVRFIKQILRQNWDIAMRIKVSEKVGKDLESFLKRYILFHLQIKPRTLVFAEQILL